MHKKAIEIIPSISCTISIGRLYWISDSKPPQSQKEAFYFCVDNVRFWLYHRNWYTSHSSKILDHSILAKCIHFVQSSTNYWHIQSIKKAKIYHYCSENFKKKANAAFLMGAFQVIFLKRTANDAWKPFASEKFTSFRDALRSPCTYECTVELSNFRFSIVLKAWNGLWN